VTPHAARITWDWAEAGRGALCALPAAVIIPAVDVTLGMVFAIATLPVAMLGVPSQRGKRPRLGLAGLAFAVRTSRWYVAGAGSGLIVLLISGISGTREFDISFAERLLETALGAGLALTFGVVIPAGLRWLTRNRAAADPKLQART